MKKDVKKLLNAVEDKLLKRMHEKPSKETLDRLAIFVGFQSWEDFRTEIDEGENVATEEIAAEDKKEKETNEPKTIEESASKDELKQKGSKRAALKAMMHRKTTKAEKNEE